mmetsp:Transcript_9429/g.17212  ORF Transcript_9429/g.17212 Transcript_9429/m.17212 type:complete len:230 (+) Transcript_9429:774-1463(+)
MHRLRLCPYWYCLYLTLRCFLSCNVWVWLCLRFIVFAARARAGARVGSIRSSRRLLLLFFFPYLRHAKADGLSRESGARPGLPRSVVVALSEERRQKQLVVPVVDAAALPVVPHGDVRPASELNQVDDCLKRVQVIWIALLVLLVVVIVLMILISILFSFLLFLKPGLDQHSAVSDSHPHCGHRPHKGVSVVAVLHLRDCSVSLDASFVKLFGLLQHLFPIPRHSAGRI